MMRKKSRFFLIISSVIAAFLATNFVYVKFFRGLPEAERATAIMHKAAVRLAASYGCAETDLERGSLNLQDNDYYLLPYRFRGPGNNSFIVLMSRDGSVDVSGSPELARYRLVKSDKDEKNGAGEGAAFREKLCSEVAK